MFKIWKLIYDTRRPELSYKKLFWVPKDQIELDMENTHEHICIRVQLS